MLRVSEADMERVGGHNSLIAGRSYYRQARVIGFARDGDVIRSRVSGSQPRPYAQVITLHETGGRIRISGECTCPIGGNCKHVVAALFHAETMASATQPAPPDFPGLIALGNGGYAIRPTSTHMATPPAPPELPANVELWLGELGRAALATEDYPETVRQRLIYVLQPVAEGLRQPVLAVQVISAKLTKDGTWAANSRPYAGANPAAIGKAHSDHLRPSDLRIMRGLAHIGTCPPTRSRYSPTTRAPTSWPGSSTPAGCAGARSTDRSCRPGHRARAGSRGRPPMRRRSRRGSTSTATRSRWRAPRHSMSTRTPA